MRAQSRVVGMLALTLALGGDARPRLDTERATEAPLAVVVGGCTALFRPAVCLRRPDADPLMLWTEEPSPVGTTWSLTWRTGPGLELPIVPVESTNDAMGTSWIVSPRITSGRVELRRSDGRGFTVELQSLSDAYLAATTESMGSAEARATLRALWAALEFDPREGYLLDCLNAQSVWTTDADAPRRLAEAASSIGDVSCRAKAHRNSAKTALEAGHYTLVEADLEVLRAAGALHLDSRLYADYFAGVLELRRGRLDHALVSLRRAADVAGRARSPKLRDLHTAIFDKLALVYFQLGYDDRARALEVELGGSTWLGLRSNLLWLAVLRREVDPHEPDPVPKLEALLVEPTLAPATARNVRLNLAIALTQNRAFDAAAVLLADLDRSKFPLNVHVFASIADARVAAGHGDLESARTILDATLERARQGPDADLELRVQFERARLEQDAGEFERAREYYADAEATTQRRLVEFGPSPDLSALSGVHTRHRAEYLQLLRELGDVDELRCVMLGARARHYQQLATRSDALAEDPERSKQLLAIAELRSALETEIADNWDASGDEQQQLRDRWTQQRRTIADAYSQLDRKREPSEPICAPWTEPEHGRLLMHPGVGDRQWLFAFEFEGTIDVFALDRADQDLPEFVAAIRNELDSRGHLAPLTQLTVVPVGELIAADFHTSLARSDRPIAVRTSLGLAPRTGSNHSGRALVYASMAGELAWAERAEGQLSRAGWSVDRTWPATLDDPPELLFYAGHGDFAGEFGWDSHLVLGDERPLTSAEIIAQRWGPSVVVLGACEAGTTSAAVMDGGMNMATAFILAGSDLVIASDQRVSAQAGTALLDLLIAEPPTTAHAGAALQRALTRAQAHGHASWRVWVR